MRNIRRLVWPAIILTICLSSGPVHGQRYKLDGTVVEMVSRHGIAALSVRLVASRQLNQPQRMTATNAEGEFRFEDLSRGRYMLEVSHGVTLLHREFLTVESDTERQITLKRR